MMNALAKSKRGWKCILIWPRCSVRDRIHTVQHTHTLDVYKMHTLDDASGCGVKVEDREQFLD